MSTSFKILMLEDDPDDAELIQQIILRGNVQARFKSVLYRHQFLEQLEKFSPDIILSDNQLPQFDATEALELTRKKSLHLPFILVTGTVSEEFAANIIRMGADDYILKDRLARLPSAIISAIQKREAERTLFEERKRSEKEMLELNEQLSQLTNHIQSIREEESTRIARDIHDQLGQQLTIMKMDASRIAKLARDTNEEIFEKTSSLLSMIDEAVRTVRKISSELRPHLLDEMGLGPAIEFYSDEFYKKTGIKTIVQGTKQELDMPEDVQCALFRIFQEGLTNVARHAKAEQVAVRLERHDEHFNMYIEDDGIGFTPEAQQGKKSFGLLGMRERVKMMNGVYQLKSAPGEGTTIKISVPKLSFVTG